VVLSLLLSRFLPASYVMSIVPIICQGILYAIRIGYLEKLDCLFEREAGTYVVEVF
jgi:hypothetical protein